MEIKLYTQYVLKLKNGLKIYFIPLIVSEKPKYCWGCVKYGDTDLPAFDKVKIDEDDNVKEIKMHSDISEYIIKQFFENKRDREDIILGYKQGQKNGLV